MSEKKKTLLRNLKIKSVSMVDQGANQHAHVLLTKRVDGEPEEKPVENDTAFFERLGKAVARLLHIPMKREEVEKDAHTFTTIDDNRGINERIWRILDALGDSLRSIVDDESITDDKKAEMVSVSADQAAAAIKSDIAGMLYGSVAKGEQEDDGNEGEGEKTDPEPHEDQPQEEPEAEEPQIQKGEETEMKFNTENMTPEERATFEDLQKRFGVPESHAEPPATPAATSQEAAVSEEDGDIYKGLHPAIKAELEAGRKLREDIEKRQYIQVAEKYKLLGRKPEELAPVLKALKDQGGTAYDDMIAMLDSNLAAVEKSGAFGEIGKSGNGGSADPWAQIEAYGEEIRKNKPELTYEEAIDRACIQHPDLVAAYEKSRG